MLGRSVKKFTVINHQSFTKYEWEELCMCNAMYTYSLTIYMHVMRTRIVLPTKETQFNCVACVVFNVKPHVVSACMT
jgi:hypothetical protein